MFTKLNDLISFIENQKRNEKKENLDYFRKLCFLFNNPQNKKKLIHIGGTNGKGSTVSFIQNILIAAGYNVGTYISPYVICFNERITYNKEYISDDDILRIGNYIISKYDQLDDNQLRHPSFFEFMTLMMFIYFSEIEKLDYVIIEVGIGGLLDITNIINPVVSAITNVSYDHMNVLGDSLEEIWDNKLGIVKPNTPFLTLNNKDFSYKAIEATNAKNSQLILVDINDVTNIGVTLDHTEFDYKNFMKLKLNMLGDHQIENAVLALEICMNINEIKLESSSIYDGLFNTFWPGRLEVVTNDPINIIDGSHNIGGINALCNFIKRIKGDKKIRLIFAVSSNKDKEKMIAMLEQYVEEIIFTHFMYKRSDDSINLYNISHHLNKKIIDDVDEIVEMTKSMNDYINIYCGSLYFISEVRSKFIK